MAIHRRLPGAAEALDVKAFDVQAHLVDVVASMPARTGCGTACLAASATAGRCLRSRAAASGSASSCAWVRRRQREVRRRQATGAAVRQCSISALQFGGVVIGQTLHRSPRRTRSRLKVQPRLNCAAVHLTVEVSQLPSGASAPCSAPPLSRRRTNRRRSLETAIELAQVVEGDAAAAARPASAVAPCIAR